MEVIDSQIITENVGFLDNFFDNSFVLQSSLAAVKEYLAEDQNEHSSCKFHEVVSCKKLSTSQNKTVTAHCSDHVETSKLTQSLRENNRNLKDWGLPLEIVRKYEQRGITEMFHWQVACLNNPKILSDCCNLVYSAPTSAGKTLVAEILSIKTILERQKKVIIILPFVSIVREKMFYLQDILSSSGFRVEGFMGSQSPLSGLQAVHVAICTIEKANSLVNQLLYDGHISELGAVIVDELHLLSDPHRGYILELLLTKIKYVSSKLEDVHIQIVGMSATLPNLEVLANWLGAQLYITQFRPIPLEEFCLVGNKLYSRQGKCVSIIDNSESGIDESDNVLHICLNTIKDNCSVLIFCMTKNRCENLAQSLASSFYKLGCTGNVMKTVLRQQLNSERISEVLEQLNNCPVGLDRIIKNSISFGVAYHHAGLTFDERDIIEGGFKSGAIRVLVATSTLSSGVNLPARKVIIRSPVFQRLPINILTYKQMIGRAGRMGKDTKGESILICTEAEKKKGFDLMMGALDPIKSCIESDDKYMRAVLEMIASQVACTKSDLDFYSQCTLLFTQQNLSASQNLLENTLKELINHELVRIQVEGDERRYVATSLGKACISASMAPNDGLLLFCELQKARQCLVLETDLHLIYLVTPYSVSSHWGDIDWLHLLTLWESLTKAMKRVGELVGIQESFIIRCLRGANKSNNVQNKINIHKRFYTALALQDLVNEVPLSEVASKFQCARGFLQSLQQSAATFAGMVTAFCRQLGWKNMEMLISQFQDRLHFGINSELLELMKLPSLNGTRARTLFNAGFETVSSIALGDTNLIENALHRAVPFQSEKERDGDDSDDIRRRNKIKNIWITGYCGMTAKEAAENLIIEARKYLEHEIGVNEINWNKKTSNSTETLLNTYSENTLKVSVKQEVCSSECTEEYENAVVAKKKPLTKECITNSTLCEDSMEIDDGDIYLSANFRKPNFEIEHNFEDSLKVDKLSKFTTKNAIIDNTQNTTSFANSNYEKKLTSLMKCGTFLKDKTNPGNGPLPSLLKDELSWDSINFTEALIQNITKQHNSHNVFLPNLCLGDRKDKSFTNNLSTPEKVSDYLVSSKSTLVKDVSLFSSDGDNSSLFEESLPIDYSSSKLLHEKNKNTESQTSKACMQVTASDFTSINSNSILNAFKSTIIETDDDEDIKLIYEEENKMSEGESEMSYKLSQENEVIDTQEINEMSVKNNFKSPFKRHAEPNKKYIPGAKKAKMKKNTILQLISKPNTVKSKSSVLKLTCSNSKTFTLEINNNKVKCFILRENDITENMHIIDNVKEASFYIDVKTASATSSHKLIGSNILKNSTPLKHTKEVNSPLIKGIAIYFGQKICIFLDLMSLGETFLLIKSKLCNWLQRKTTKLKMMSLKCNYVELKKCFGINLPLWCFDVSLAEWLIDSDEKIPNIVYLTKKYCEIDLSSVLIKCDIESKNFKNLDTYENLCVKAWCVWTIANKQEQYLTEQFHNVHNIIDIEIQVSKILANCEYCGLTVDKNLASQLLMDVKQSQEILQKKAFKLCGYHFNFNSSKDVAKVLGIYTGHKVSTKKSVLTSHTSPISSIVIFWRKLNSILTKTLYPLTERARMYSEGNRINPTYNMYTCTGRISMHEPNLQNVPRTFTIPEKHLNDSEHCDGVIEFNCRNIFHAAPGCVLVSADYCQLEMRILTHYSGDDVLTKIMRSDVDVFKSIAASWGNVPENEVVDENRIRWALNSFEPYKAPGPDSIYPILLKKGALYLNSYLLRLYRACIAFGHIPRIWQVKVDDELRQKAKQLCYGILYGMGARTLAQHLDVAEMEAAVFMDTFYKTYPAIRVFTQSLIEQCRKKGFVETLKRRRRYLPDINSNVASKKSTAERQAVNTTIQGSAADIAKAAMCAVDARTDAELRRARLLLQMHDELIYEVPETEKDTFIYIIKQVMEDTVRLNVPLPVKVRSGYTWGTLQEIKF